ncbi:hypothetical protein [Sphingobium estronivorans]|uniref:hypothetical protein n=1 Tax=Sphingobium estronivorans TaxID=1577690 RepID=UPI00123AAF12|nr:hypothetical protein [Sphingobium estronivorans]
MRFGFGYGPTGGRPGAPGASAAVIGNVAANGWQATMVSPADLALAPVTVLRQGFDASAQIRTVPETMFTTKRVRNVYPAQASLTDNQVALNDYILATDIIAGVTNDSGETSPRPLANWVTPDRLLVGNSIGGAEAPVELVAFHYHMRGGRQVAAVRFLISDGTSTIAVLASTPTVSGRSGDQNAVIVHALPATDISALAEGPITVNAEVYPHVGGAASVVRSADMARGRDFSPRYFRKDVGRCAAPPLAYVSVDGNDGTGLVSTLASAAKTLPFLTVSAALDAIQSAYGASGSGIDGCRIRVMAGGDIMLGSGAAIAKTQKLAAVVVERDPDAAFGDARLIVAGPRPRLGSGGSIMAPLATGCIHLRNLRIQRTTTSSFAGEAATRLEIVFDNVDYDNNGQAAGMFSNSDAYVYGMTLTGATSQLVGASANGQWRVWRGLKLDNGGAVFNVEGYLVVGSTIRRTGSLGSATGQIHAFNRFYGAENLNAPFSVTGTDKAAIQNVYEFVSATSAVMTGITPDNASLGASNILFCNNSLAGFNDHGRSNHAYDEGAAQRNSKFIRQHGNIFVQLNCKGDVFQAQGTRTGNFAYKHGVGCTDNFTQFRSANGDLVGQGASFAQDFAGLGANFGTSNSLRNDPLYAAPAATTAGPVAGAGGGDYRLQPGSPCKRSASAVLSHDLAGNIRPTEIGTDSRGAYL